MLRARGLVKGSHEEWLQAAVTWGVGGRRDPPRLFIRMTSSVGILDLSWEGGTLLWAHGGPNPSTTAGHFSSLGWALCSEALPLQVQVQ